MLCLRSC